MAEFMSMLVLFSPSETPRGYDTLLREISCLGHGRNVVGNRM